MPTTPPARLLIVDDEAPQMEALRNTLADEGYITAGCTSAAEALAALRRQEFDLIVTDLMMPGVDGIEFLREALEVDPNLVGIVMTGHGTIDTAVAAMKAGALDYILKPFKLSAIIPVLSRALAVRQLRVENIQLRKHVAERTERLEERNRQMEEELAMARELQMAMLPHRFPSVPRDTPPAQSAVRFYSVYQPAGSVSGDIFDVIPLADGSIGIFIGDVMGHDVRAALITAMIRALVQELSATLLDPGALLGEVNRQLKAILKQADLVIFATAAYLIVSFERSRVIYANAGHPAPIHLRRSLGEAEPMYHNGDTGPALGLFEETTYKTCHSSLSAGDCIILFTDGLFEVEAANEELYGEDRLRNAISQKVGLSAEELLNGLLAESLKFAGRQNFDDDICLLAVEVNRLGSGPVERGTSAAH